MDSEVYFFADWVLDLIDDPSYHDDPEKLIRKYNEYKENRSKEYTVPFVSKKYKLVSISNGVEDKVEYFDTFEEMIHCIAQLPYSDVADLPHKFYEEDEKLVAEYQGNRYECVFYNKFGKPMVLSWDLITKVLNETHRRIYVKDDPDWMF